MFDRLLSKIFGVEPKPTTPLHHSLRELSRLSVQMDIQPYANHIPIAEGYRYNYWTANGNFSYEEVELVLPTSRETLQIWKDGVFTVDGPWVQRLELLVNTRLQSLRKQELDKLELFRTAARGEGG